MDYTYTPAPWSQQQPETSLEGWGFRFKAAFHANQKNNLALYETKHPLPFRVHILARSKVAHHFLQVCLDRQGGDGKGEELQRRDPFGIPVPRDIDCSRQNRFQDVIA